MNFIGILFIIALTQTTTLSATEELSVEFGNQQVSQMLSDRTALKTYETQAGQRQEITTEDSLWRWAADAFQQGAEGAPIYWSNELPNKKCNQADNAYPTSCRKGIIRVSPIFLCGPSTGTSVLIPKFGDFLILRGTRTGSPNFLAQTHNRGIIGRNILIESSRPT